MRKPVSGFPTISDKPDHTAREDGKRLEISNLGSRRMVLSAPLLFFFAYAKCRFSYDAVKEHANVTCIIM